MAVSAPTQKVFGLYYKKELIYRGTESQCWLRLLMQDQFSGYKEIKRKGYQIKFLFTQYD